MDSKDLNLNNKEMPSRRASRHIENKKNEPVMESDKIVDDLFGEVNASEPDSKMVLPKRKRVRESSVVNQADQVLKEKISDQRKKPVNHVEFETVDLTDDISAIEDVIDEPVNNSVSTKNVVASSNSLKSKKSKKNPSKNGKIVLAAILAIVIVAAIIGGIVFFSKKENNSSHDDNFMEQIKSQEIMICEDNDIIVFFTNYYQALCSGNTSVLEEMYDKPDSADISAGISTLVESYNNLIVYTTQGIKNNEIAVFVRNDVKFNNISTLAPSLDCFYLVKNAQDGSIKIKSEMYSNADIIRFLTLCSYRDPIKSVLSEVNSSLDVALSSDKELKNLYIVMQSMTNAVLNDESDSKK